MPKNRTDCSTCQHKQYPDGGHCYMFQKEPDFDCQIHTDNKTPRPKLSKTMLGLVAAAAVMLSEIPE